MRSSRLEEVRRALAQNGIFGALSERDLQELIAYGVTASFGSRKTIFQKGDAGDSMMVVLTGRVKISNYSAEGKEAVLNFIEPGQVFGEIALLDGRPRTADAAAMEPTELFVMRRRELLPFLRSHPQVAIRLIEILCAKLRHTTEMVEDMVFLNLGPRIARALLRLAEEHGRKRDSSIRLDMKLRQRELGGYVGLSREITNRQLMAWREEGLITVDGGYITILDEAGLRRVSGE
jgi:CRP-like cAMP-binding protein